MSDVPVDASSTSRSAVRGAGGRALIVGGWVRDRTAWNRPDKAEPRHRSRGLSHRARSIARAARSVWPGGGASARLSGLQARRRSTSRCRARDSKAGRGHRGFVVVGDPDMSIAEAARRRDFTVNAISWDPLTEEYFDPFDGRGDIERRLLRDGRRRRRLPTTACACCARSSSPRGFELRARRGDARRCAGASPLDDLPAERIWGEIEKLLLAARPSIGFALAMDLGVVAQLFPELQALAGCPQEPEWHPEGDVWVHTLQVDRSGADARSTISSGRSRSP